MASGRGRIAAGTHRGNILKVCIAENGKWKVYSNSGLFKKAIPMIWGGTQ